MNTEMHDWDRCPDGEIRRMVDDVRASHRRQTIGRIASITALALVVVTSVAIASPWLFSSDHHPGGISCYQVRELLPAYAQQSLDEGLMQQVSRHLNGCPHCHRIHVQQQQVPIVTNDTAGADAAVAALLKRR